MIKPIFFFVSSSSNRFNTNATVNTVKKHIYENRKGCEYLKKHVYRYVFLCMGLVFKKKKKTCCLSLATRDVVASQRKLYADSSRNHGAITGLEPHTMAGEIVPKDQQADRDPGTCSDETPSNTKSFRKLRWCWNVKTFNFLSIFISCLFGE